MRNINKIFGERFKSLRTQKKITQEDLLKDFNKIYNRSYTAAAISQFENGKRIPEIDALTDFAEYYDVSIDYLLGVTNTKNSLTQENKAVLKSNIENKIIEILPDLSEEQKNLLLAQIELTLSRRRD